MSVLFKMGSMARSRVIPTPRKIVAATFFCVALLMSTGVLADEEAGPSAITNTCTNTAAASGISVVVDAKAKTVTFVCDKTINHVLPSHSDSTLTTYYTEKGLEHENDLAGLFGQGSAAAITNLNQKSPGASQVTLTLVNLPQKKQTIYFACSTTPAGGAAVGAALTRVEQKTNDKCVVTVTVPADPDANTCSVAKENMILEINSESKTASFHCDTDIATLAPGTVTQIFDESCENEVRLAEKLPSASLTDTDSGYQFTVEELPEAAATFCYKCSAASDSDNKELPEGKNNACTVTINVAAADLDSDSAASATPGSVSALVLGFAVSLIFAKVLF
uniref:SRS domain-containing protein n=1 Tax=Neospora caninum (strain Liverpool) TaxID=572307 RepID=F0JB57_NEOCL|nr:SRS domain-containing protein [Neospora caninum Liverpool]CEL71324.1 TPA: SRS domain-containing protein [Neospora caninum Liverpool]